MNFKKYADEQLIKNPSITNRSIELLKADINAVRCLAQAAVNVELFTIPPFIPRHF